MNRPRYQMSSSSRMLVFCILSAFGCQSITIMTATALSKHQTPARLVARGWSSSFDKEKVGYTSGQFAGHPAAIPAGSYRDLRVDTSVPGGPLQPRPPFGDLGRLGEEPEAIQVGNSQDLTAHNFIPWIPQQYRGDTSGVKDRSQNTQGDVVKHLDLGTTQELFQDGKPLTYSDSGRFEERMASSNGHDVRGGPTQQIPKLPTKSYDRSLSVQEDSNLMNSWDAQSRADGKSTDKSAGVSPPSESLQMTEFEDLRPGSFLSLLQGHRSYKNVLQNLEEAGPSGNNGQVSPVETYESRNFAHGMLPTRGKVMDHYKFPGPLWDRLENQASNFGPSGRTASGHAAIEDKDTGLAVPAVHPSTSNFFSGMRDHGTIQGSQRCSPESRMSAVYRDSTRRESPDTYKQLVRFKNWFDALEPKLQDWVIKETNFMTDYEHIYESYSAGHGKDVNANSKFKDTQSLQRSKLKALQRTNELIDYFEANNKIYPSLDVKALLKKYEARAEKYSSNEDKGYVSIWNILKKYNNMVWKE